MNSNNSVEVAWWKREYETLHGILDRKVAKVAALIPEGHEGQHEPGPDLHGWTSPCWPCEIAKALKDE